MKKSIFLFFFLPLLMFSSISQKELLQKLDFKNAKEYIKTKKVLAREAFDEENIVTITSDGIETTNKAKKGDIIVKSTTSAKEQYVMSKEKFLDKYVFFEKIDDTWDMYTPTSMVKGIMVTDEILKLLNVDSPFYIKTAFNSEMIVKKNDFLVSPKDNSEVYRIAKKEFFETYERYEKRACCRGN